MTVRIGKNDYVTVAERVTACHADEGFSMLSEETFALSGRSFLRITIEVKSKRYIGTSEIKFDAPKNTPDGQSPIECAQTSSLGRALGAAGYGSVDSIASADELVRNQAPAPTAPAPQVSELDSIKAEVKKLGLARNPASWVGWKHQVLGKDIGDNRLTLAHLKKMREVIAAAEQSA